MARPSLIGVLSCAHAPEVGRLAAATPATKAKQAQSRIKTLERMELIAAAHVDSPFSFEFPATEIHARQLVKFDQAILG